MGARRQPRRPAGRLLQLRRYYTSVILMTPALGLRFVETFVRVSMSVRCTSLSSHVRTGKLPSTEDRRETDRVAILTQTVTLDLDP